MIIVYIKLQRVVGEADERKLAAAVELICLKWSFLEKIPSVQEWKLVGIETQGSTSMRLLPCKTERLHFNNYFRKVLIL